MKGQVNIDLKEFDLIIINSSGGKDSLCSIWEVCRMADAQGYPKSKIKVSHQDLGEVEWKGTKELAQQQADHFGLGFEISQQRNKDGKNETLLEYVEERGKWPSNKARFCTSDFKRGPGARVVTKLSKGLGDCRVLYVFGFRKAESPSRSKKEILSINTRLQSKKRTVIEFLPIHNWSDQQVWDVIKGEGLPYHPAYDLGMPRLSCCFCIFSPFDALIVAGRANPELLEKYVALEARIGHSFKNGESIKSVQDAISAGYEPGPLHDWVM